MRVLKQKKNRSKTKKIRQFSSYYVSITNINFEEVGVGRLGSVRLRRRVGQEKYPVWIGPLGAKYVGGGVIIKGKKNFSGHEIGMSKRTNVKLKGKLGQSYGQTNHFCRKSFV